MILSSKNKRRLVVDPSGNLVNIEIADATKPDDLKSGWRDATEADVSRAKAHVVALDASAAAVSPHSTGGVGNALDPAPAKPSRAAKSEA